jgi:hypothetical protein
MRDDDRRQESIDAFYCANGPCCAGCDWWRSINSVAGECSRSAPMAGDERFAMLGVQGASLKPGAGHAMTPRGHLCGEFKDEFDWQSLPPSYLRRIGFPLTPTP